MFKKLFTLILVLITLLVSTISCGNMSMGWGNFDFKRAHISLGNQETCIKIVSWHDNEIGCEVKLENGQVMFLSEGTYILMKDDVCPLCNLNNN